MILLYSVTHKNYPKPIELCGEFRDWKHFEAFKKVEEFRGWFVTGIIKVLKD